jgi:hypothetical protein
LLHLSSGLQAVHEKLSLFQLFDCSPESAELNVQ